MGGQINTPEQTAADELGWFRELTKANATLPAWLLVVFLIAGLVGLAVGLFGFVAG